MKAICKKAFAVGVRSYKPGDEVEASPQTMRGYEWHGYVELPVAIEHAAEAVKGAAEKALEAVGIKKKKKK